MQTMTQIEWITQTAHYEEVERIDQQVVLISQELKWVKRIRHAKPAQFQLNQVALASSLGNIFRQMKQ